MKNKCIVLDFETTGLSPGADRAIEVAAVLLENGEVKDRFQTLMNPGMRVSSFIESYTGISNAMLASAPKNEKAIRELRAFVGKLPLVAHNASFDKRFLDYEVARAGCDPIEVMACSLLVSRRLYDQTVNHKLKTLVEYKNIKVVGNFHRALADAEMTAHLWVKMKEDIEKKYKVDEATFEFMFRFGKTGKKGLEKFVSGYFKKPDVE